MNVMNVMNICLESTLGTYSTQNLHRLRRFFTGKVVLVLEPSSTAELRELNQ